MDPPPNLINLESDLDYFLLDSNRTFFFGFKSNNFVLDRIEFASNSEVCFFSFFGVGDNEIFVFLTSRKVSASVLSNFSFIEVYSNV